MSLWSYLLLATAAGLLLNLTPCVLPALPIKLRSIGRVVGHSPIRRLLAGVTFLAGTLTFFGALALATVWLNWTWGTIFQSPTFRTALALILSGLGIWSLAGYGVQPPQWAYRIQGKGYGEPYLAGLLAAVLSAPCTGPFLGGVLAFALTQSPAAIIAIFLAIGMGLALPYLVLLAWPKLLTRMPRGGIWMHRVHQLLGFILLGGAVFFVSTVLPSDFTPVLWSVWSGGLTLWLLRTLYMGPDRAARLVPSLTLVGIIVVAFALGTLVTADSRSSLAWQPLTDSLLTRARSEERAVLIEFTADWCINCKVLEHTVYRDERVLDAVRSAGVLPVRADLTQPSPRLEKYLREFGGAGLPFAVILDAQGNVKKRLPDLFTVETLVAALKHTRSEK